MESRRRNVWIAVAALALVVTCCCVAAASAVAARWFSDGSYELGSSQQERLERSFDAEEISRLDVDNPVGSVGIRGSDGDAIQVVVVKKATAGRYALDEIDVQIEERAGSLRIRIQMPSRLRNLSADLEITVPADTHVNLNLGAGVVDVRGMNSQVDVQTGAANVEMRDVRGAIGVTAGAGRVSVRRAVGPVRLRVGAGLIEYQGTPTGACSLDAAVGIITLRLPDDLDMEVDLSAKIGVAGVDHHVDGRVGVRRVEGTIGDGDEGSIGARVAVGAINLDSR